MGCLRRAVSDVSGRPTTGVVALYY